MSRIKHRRPSLALIVSVLALFVALGGTAVAVKSAPKNSVTSKSIKNNTIKSSDIKNKKGVKGKDVKDDSLKGSDIDESSLGSVPSADSAKSADSVAELDVFGDSWIRATATNGASEAAARTAAPEIALAKKGQLDIYAKCFRDTSGPETFGEIYIRTSAAGAVFESRDEDSLIGGNATSDFLNPGTTETDRQISETSVTGTGTAFAGADDEDFHVFASDGTNLEGQLATVVKQGSLTAGNGVFGAGNVCLFGGFAIG